MNSLTTYILSYPSGLTVTFLRAILFKPVIMLFLSINESIVKYILSSELMKIFFMYINAFFNLAKLPFQHNFFIKCYYHVYSSNNASSK